MDASLFLNMGFLARRPSESFATIPLIAVMRAFLITLIPCFLSALGILPPLVDSATAATYFIDAANGDDANGGNTEQTAWKTLNKVNNTVFQAGDSVLLNRNGVWKERLVVPNSGTESNPIIFGAYGVGANPVLEAWTDVISEGQYQWILSNSASDPLTGKYIWFLKWKTCNQDYLYFTYLGATLLDGDHFERLDRLDAPPGMGLMERANYLKHHLRDKEYTWISALPEYSCWTYVLRYDRGLPSDVGARFFIGNQSVVGTYQTDSGASAAIANLIDTNGMNNIIIENIDVRGALATSDSRSLHPAAILINGSRNVRIKDSEVAYNWVGVRFNDLGSAPPVGNRVENLDIHDNLGAGVYLKGHASENIIKNNRIRDNYARKGDGLVGDKLAIGCTGPEDMGEERSGNKITGNRIYNNANHQSPTNRAGILDAAVSIYSCAETTIEKNVIMNNVQGAFYTAHGSHDTKFISNIVAGNSSIDFHHTRFQKSPKSQFVNNLIYKNALHATTQERYNDYFSMFINDGSGGLDMRNNIFLGNEGTSMAPSYPVRLLNIRGAGNRINNNGYHENSMTFDDQTPSGQFYISGTTQGIWQAGEYTALPDWQIGTGHDGDSSDIDPRLITEKVETPNDLVIQLEWDSPMIDNGTDAGLISDYYGNPIYGTPDIGAIEYQPPYMMGIDQIDTTGNVRIYANGKFRNKSAPSGIAADLVISPEGGFIVDDYREWMNITIEAWDHGRRKWAETSVSASDTRHTVGDLVPGVTYDVRVTEGMDTQLVNCNGAACVADNDGRIAFTSERAYAPRTFTVTPR